MRLIIIFLFAASLVSCESGERPYGGGNKTIIDTTLRLPSVVAGIPVDTTMSSLRISLVYERLLSDTALSNPYDPMLLIEFDSVTNTKVMNVYADSGLGTAIVDSAINKYWRGQDVCLIGINNGIELGIPFHGLHRFPPQQENHNTLPEQYYNLKIFPDHYEVNDWTFQYRSGDNFFAPFYSDAFSPYDSSSKYPSRARQSVNALMSEGAGWDGINLREGSDSAQKLAAYNEFVNKLEIFDKAGTFWTMRVAMIDVTYYESLPWFQFMRVAGAHYHWLSVKRNAAKQYLADYIANKGSDPSQQFTNEDLHLLYPDRLRWNGFISGEMESRYDADMLTDW